MADAWRGSFRGQWGRASHMMARQFLTHSVLRHRQMTQCERLLDHLVSAAEQRERYGETERLSRLEVYYEFNLR